LNHWEKVMVTDFKLGIGSEEGMAKAEAESERVGGEAEHRSSKERREKRTIDYVENRDW